MQSIPTKNYNIIYGSTVYDELNSFITNGNYSSYFILVDSNTHKHCLSHFVSSIPDLPHFEILEMDAGEENKNIDIAIGLWNALTELGADRNSLLINLGGGVVTDMGGFVASTFKRGIDFIHIPTTLLNMVDASIGGKTGVDLGVLKNQVGVFSNPQLVIVDIDFLKTLEQREFISGFAEIVKYAISLDTTLWEKIQNFSSENTNILEDIILHSAQMKVDVVEEDFLETGLRKVLNVGHTLGHAIESYFLQHDQRENLLHGEAIAVGIITELYLAEKYCDLNPSVTKKIEQFLANYFPIQNWPKEDNTLILDYLKHDKKNKGGKINCTLITDLGKHQLNVFPSNEDFEWALNRYNNV